MPGRRVFISYAARDVAAAASLEDALTALDLDAWRDRSRIEHDWSREIARALAERDVVIVLWSAMAAESQWVRREWLTARALGKPIVPCLLAGAPPLPWAIKNLQAVIASGNDDDGRKLAAGIVARIAMIQANPPPPYDYAVVPDECAIPFNHNPTFVGRDSELLELYLNAVGNLNNARTLVGLCGMAGVGKTQLATEFGLRFAFGFDGVHWIQAAQDWQPQFAALAKRLGCKISHPDADDAGQQYVRALGEYCSEHRQMLLIIDNVLDPAALAHAGAAAAETLEPASSLRTPGVAPFTLGCNILFTTRHRFNLRSLNVIEQRVGILSPNSSYDLLTAFRKPSDDAETMHANAVANILGFLPLALVLASHNLEHRSWVTFGDYLAALHGEGLDALDLEAVSDDELATRHAAAVGSTLRSQLAELRDSDATLLFDLAGWFGESELVPKARLALLAGHASIDSSLRDPALIAISALIRASLVDEADDGRSIRLHPLVRQFSRARNDAVRDTFRGTAAQRLINAYRVLQVIECQTKRRGIPHIIADLETAEQWSTDEALKSEAAILARLLDRERRALETDRDSSFFLQLHYRAVNMGLATLAAAFFERANAAQPLALRCAWAVEREDPYPLKTFIGFGDPIVAVRADATGARVLCGSADGVVIVWEVGARGPFRTFRGPWKTIRDLAFTSTDEILVAGTIETWVDIGRTEDVCVTVWNAQTREPVGTFGHAGLISLNNWDQARIHAAGWDCLEETRIDGDGRTLATVSREGTLILWDIAAGKRLAQHWLGAILSSPGRSNVPFIRRTNIDRTGRLAITAIGSELVVWDLESGALLHRMTAEDFRITNLALSSRTNTALVAGDLRYALVDLTAGRIIRRGRTMAEQLAVSLPTERSRGVVGHRDGSVTLSDWSSALDEPPTSRGHSASIGGVDMTPDGELILSGSDDETLGLWTADGRMFANTPQYSEPHSGTIRKISLDPTGRRAVYAQHVYVRAVAIGAAGTQELGRFTGPTRCNDVRITPDGSRALCVYSRTIFLWTIGRSGSWTTLTFERRVTAAEILDERTAAVVFADGELGICDLLPLKTRAMLPLTAPSVAISARIGCRRLVSLTADGTLTLWDTERFTIVHQLQSNNDLAHIRLDTGGRYASALSKDRYRLSAWNLEDGKILSTIRLQNQVTDFALASGSIAVGDDVGILTMFHLPTG